MAAAIHVVPDDSFDDWVVRGDIGHEFGHYGTREAAELAAQDVGVSLSENLIGNIWVNQSAAFSDFHATGANPAANASLTDGAFVAGRFRIVQSRRPAVAPS